MLIEKIVSGKKTSDVYSDGIKYGKILGELILKYGVRRGESVDDAVFSALLEENDKLSAKEYLFKLLALNSRTEKEARQKLREKGFRPQSVREAVDAAKSYGYISDKLYAESYASLYGETRGLYRLRNELKEKGVSEDIIDAVLDGKDETDACRAVMEKFLRNKKADEKLREKLFRHLASRGFSYSVIKEVAGGGYSEDDF